MADRTGDFLGHVFNDSSPAGHLGHPAFPDPEELVRAIDQERDHIFRNLGNGVEEGESVFSCYCPDYVELASLPDFPERDDASVRDGYAPVGNDFVYVQVGDHSQSLAMRAISLRRVEGEGVRLRFRYGNTRVGTDKVLGVVADFPGLQVKDCKRTLAVV